MNVTNQPPNTFASRRRTTTPQPGSQIRPENNLPTSADPDTDSDFSKLIATIKKAFKDYGDLLYQLRNGWTPLALYTAGDTTSDPILVPVQASASDLGTGITMQVQFTRAGSWILGTSVSLNAIGDTGNLFILRLTVNDSPQALAGVQQPAGDGSYPIVQFWQVTSLTGDETCVLKISKITGGGTSAVIPASSTMMATWQGRASVNLILERATDMQLVRTIMTHPKLYPHLTDDYSPTPEDFQPVEHESYIYLLVRDGDDLLGLFFFHPHTASIWEVHTCLLPGAWGDRGKAAAALSREWIWENLQSCIRIITNVPSYNRLALRFAKTAGMEQFGENPDSFVKASKVYTLLMLGVSRPGIEVHRGEPCQQ